MKKLLVVSAIAALGLTSATFAGGIPEEMPATPAASDTGIYIGVEGGYGLTNWKDTGNVWGYDYSVTVDKDTGFVGRAFLGYDINRYFAIEAGYSYFFNKTGIKADGYTESHIRTNAIDLFGKGKLPVVDDFDLFAKLGGAYLMGRASDGTMIPTSVNNYCLAFGAGADYYITPNVIANIEWLRYEGHTKFDGSESKTEYQPHTDAFMIGLRYKFDL